MKSRLLYRGGKQKDRMAQDKLHSLKKAILYSYQAETAIVPNGKEFGCLINPNKLTMEADDKQLSIPFEEIPLGEQEIEPIDLRIGDIIGWKENGTYWILYQRYWQEDAYYRFGMRQCNAEVEINGEKYRIYIKGPDEKTIDWQKTKRFFINDLNYSLEMYISKSAKMQTLKRFSKVKIANRPWEVQAVDDITIDGMLLVYLKEDFTNDFEMREQAPENPIDPLLPHIEGDSKVYPYDIKTYKIVGATGGQWLLSNGRARLNEVSDSSALVEITTGKSGDVSLIYKTQDNEIIYNIKIQSL